MHLVRPVFAFALLACVTPTAIAVGESLRRIEEAEFGRMADGTAVQHFTLRNAKGMVARVISYGAIITELQAPDRHGAMTNVVPILEVEALHERKLAGTSCCDVQMRPHSGIMSLFDCQSDGLGA